MPMVFRSFAALLILMAVQGSAAGAPQGKHAVLVGVSKYERKGLFRYTNLNSSQDVLALKEVLISRYGFRSQDITVLNSPEQTTRAKILAAFRENLIKKVKPNDIVFFHFSGHGSQTPDTGNEESDKLDETIVPSDYISTRNHARDIRDDELRALLVELSRKRPGHVLLSFDCCHASGMSRDPTVVVRGRSWVGDPFVAPGKAAPHARGGESAELTDDAPNTHVVAACPSGGGAHEIRLDSGIRMGVFTFALARALNLADPKTSYADLQETVKRIVTSSHRSQMPIVVGQKTSPVLMGTASRQSPLIRIAVEGGKRTVFAGSLHGVTAGSLYKLWGGVSETGLARDLLGEAEIQSVGLVRSEVKVVRRSPTWKSRSSPRFAQEILHHHRDNRLRVDLSKVRGTPHASSLAKALGNLPLVAQSEHPGDADLSIHPDPEDTSRLMILRRDGVPAAILSEGQISSALRDTVESESRWLFVRALENDSPTCPLRVDLRVVPVEVDKDGRYLRDACGLTDLDGLMTLSVGDHAMLEVRIAGAPEAYLTVLDLRSDGRIAPVWPHPALKTDNRMPGDGKWHRIAEPAVYIVEEADEHEILKAIVTVHPVDFSSVLSPGFVDVANRGAESNPLALLLRAANTGQRVVSPDISPEGWAAGSCEFRAVPALSE